MGVRILTRSEADARPLRGKVRHSLRSSAIGAVVLAVYGGGLVYLRHEHGLPLPIVLFNAPVFALFVYFWARTLRRALGGHLPFLLAATDSTLLVPLATLERTLPKELDLYLEVPFSDIESARLVDTRYTLPGSSGGRPVTRLVRIPSLTLTLREPSEGVLEETLARFQGAQGFQGVSVHAAAPDVVEVSLLGHASRMRAVKALLAKVQPRLSPTEEVVRVAHPQGASEDEVRATAARLESFGSGLGGGQLLRAHGLDDDDKRAVRAGKPRAKLPS